MNRMLSIIAIVLVTAMVTVLWWGLYPYRVMEFVESPSVTAPEGQDAIVAGGQAFWKAHYRKNLPLEATISAQIIDEFIVSYASFKSNVPVGEDTLGSEFKIPNFINGECYLLITLTYSPNPLRVVTYTVKSKPFTVVKNTCKGGKGQ